MDEEIEPLEYSTHPFAESEDAIGLRWISGVYRDVSTPFGYHGYHWSSGGLHSTTAELARWALALWGSDEVVSATSLDEMTNFLGLRYDYVGLGVYAACPCWLDGPRLRPDRWSHLGVNGTLEYDPVDKVALSIRVSSQVDEPFVIEALDDLSTRLRTLIRGRSFGPELIVAQSIPAADAANP
jgi:hypothetical protein